MSIIKQSPRKIQRGVSVALAVLIGSLSIAATAQAVPCIDCGGGGGGGGGGGAVEPFNPPPPPYRSFQAPNVTLPEDGVDPNRLYVCGDTPHVWIGFSYDVTRGTTVYPTGVVVPGTRVNFHFFNPAGQLVARHLTQRARANCVIHHEDEAMSTAGLAPGYYFVYASYWSMTNPTVGFPVPNVGALVLAMRIR